MWLKVRSSGMRRWREPSLLVRPTFFCGVGKIDLWLNGAIACVMGFQIAFAGGALHFSVTLHDCEWPQPIDASKLQN